eukprot:13663675-Ditylum_brightwellii.AAC.1
MDMLQESHQTSVPIMMRSGSNQQRCQGKNISYWLLKEEKGRDVGPRSERRGKKDWNEIGMEMMMMMIGNIK